MIPPRTGSTYGAPGWLVGAWVGSHTAVAAGEMAEVSRDVERLTGRPALTLRDLLAR